MNAQTLNVLLAHPFTTAGVIGALGAFFALTSNFVRTVDGIKDWLKGKKEPEKEPTKEDVRDAGVPAFGQPSSFGKSFLKGTAAAVVGAYAVDGAVHAATHSHDVASSVTGHVGAFSDHAAHAGIADHAMHHADSIWDVLSGFFEAILG
jgi:hypothetical protein